jgi:hypothetical protein
MYYLLRTPNSVSFSEIAPCWNEYLWRSCMSLKYILTMTHNYSAYLGFSGNKTKCVCHVVLKAPVTKWAVLLVQVVSILHHCVLFPLLFLLS